MEPIFVNCITHLIFIVGIISYFLAAVAMGCDIGGQMTMPLA